MHKLTLAMACIALMGCAATITPTLPAKRTNVAGLVAPCSADGRGSRSCGDALFNATVISQIHKGQSQNEVRGIMGHDAERRTVDQYTESWGYLTSYENQMMTWITFTDRTVSSLSHEVVGGH